MHLAQLVNDLLESFSLVIIFLLDSLHLLSLEQLDLFSNSGAHSCTLTLLDKLYRLVLIGHSGHMRRGLLWNVDLIKFNLVIILNVIWFEIFLLKIVVAINVTEVL